MNVRRPESREHDGDHRTYFGGFDCTNLMSAAPAARYRDVVLMPGTSTPTVDSIATRIGLEGSAKLTRPRFTEGLRKNWTTALEAGTTLDEHRCSVASPPK